MSPLLRAKDVAEIMAIPLSTLKKNVSANPSAVPPSLKLGNQPNSPVRWRRCDVERWIQAQFDSQHTLTKGESIMD